jgi:hypothetical protein
MAARRSADHFDMLPFIAILMCTLGTLLLVTLCMAAVNLGPGAGESWMPTVDPAKMGKRPILFEWNGAVLIAQTRPAPSRYDIPIAAYEETPNGSAEEAEQKALMDAGFEQLRSGLIADLSQHADREYALFAVRPSGFKTFNRIKQEFVKEHIAVGYEPIEQSRAVRLGHALDAVPQDHPAPATGAAPARATAGADDTEAPADGSTVASADASAPSQEDAVSQASANLHLGLALTKEVQAPNGDGDLIGTVTSFTIGSAEIALATNDILHDGSGAPCISTRDFGKIRIGGAYGGVRFWLTPAQGSALMKYFSATGVTPASAADATPPDTAAATPPAAVP